MARDRGFERVDGGAVARGDEHDRRRPARAGLIAERKGALEFARGAFRERAEVCFVDGDHVGQFEHAGLQELHGVARGGLRHEYQRVHQIGDVGFALADADGFDDHHVEDSGHDGGRSARRIREAA
jgi:hypothetical protein